jgi:hypothetical protein
MKINPDAPIYPATIAADCYGGKVTTNGMTIRAQFAMAAMQGICAANDPGRSYEQECEIAVKYADLLIAELNK